MALTKTEIMDLIIEERQILESTQQAADLREAAVTAAGAVYAAALNQAAADYTAATQAAESRLLDVRRTLKQDGTWKGGTARA